MSHEWTNDITLRFIELYHGEPVLWEPLHTYHKDKKHINDAWLRLSEALEIPIADLKKKKESLMATFSSQLRRKKASSKSGAGVSDIYKPIWFAYESMEAFLGSVYECNTTINTQNVVESAQSDPEINQKNNTVNEEITGETTNIPVTNAPTPTTRTPTASQQTIRRRVNPPELLEAGKQMKEAFNMLNNVMSKRIIEEDECDLFEKMLAKKLRRLPENERDHFMYDIDGMFVNRLRRFNQSSASTSHSSLYASSINSPDFHSPPPTPFSGPPPEVINIPNKSPSTHFSYSEPFYNLKNISNRPSSSCSTYSEPTYIVNNNRPQFSHTPKISNISILAEETIPRPQDILSQAYHNSFESESQS